MSITSFWRVLTEDMEPETRRSLRHMTFIGVFAFHVAWACGWLPGVSGFALAQDVRPVVEEMRMLRVELTERDILDSHSLRCATEIGELRHVYSMRVQRLLRRYHEITGVPYPLEPCPGTRGGGWLDPLSPEIGWMVWL